MQDLYATTFTLAAEDGSDPLTVGAVRAESWPPDDRQPPDRALEAT